MKLIKFLPFESNKKYGTHHISLTHHSSYEQHKNTSMVSETTIESIQYDFASITQSFTLVQIHSDFPIPD